MKKNFPYRMLTASSDRLTVKFDKDKLQDVTSKQNQSFQLEVINNNRLGFAVANQANEDDLLTKAISSSEFGDLVHYDYPTKVQLPNVQIYSEKVAKLLPQDLIQIGKFLVESIKEENPEILVDVILRKTEGMVKLEHSRGFEDQQPATNLTIFSEGTLVSEGDILAIGNQYSWADQTFNQSGFIEKIKNRFRLSKRISQVPSGHYPVIFSPETAADLLETVVDALSAQTVFKKVSKWTNLHGKQVVDKRLSLIDDPTIDFANGSTKFDEEGSAAQPINLIENGILKNFYTDLRNAEKLGIKPNGRGFGIPATPSVTNLVMTLGNKPSADLIKNIKQGIWVDQVVGAGQDSPYSGDFSVNVQLGFLISNGEIVGRVKNYLISGNIFDMLKNNLMDISSDFEWIGGSAKLPSLLFSDVNLIGA